MSLYDDSEFPVEDAVAALHADELASLARTGTWFTGAERTAIAAEARRARVAEGIQESIGDEARADAADLTESARELTRTLALGGIDIDRAFVERITSNGVSEEQYVEITGVVARAAHLDVFARGIGVPARALPTDVDVGEPPRVRPPEAVDEGFHVASVPEGEAGGETGKSIYHGMPTANILRSLSLVPDEAKRLNRVMDREYLNIKRIMDWTDTPFEALARPQVELVAAKVSALNQCFY